MSTDTSPAVVITGCSTGIGRATARLLDEKGYRVFPGVRKESDAQSLRDEGSERMQPLLLDVTDAASIDQAAKEISETLGEQGLLGLVNNAGIGFGGPMEFTNLDEMRSGFEVNVFGPVAAAIHRALSADRPRARYTVGKDAKLLSVLNRLLPDRGKDTILGRLHEL